MKLLLDQNLSRFLVGSLSEPFPGSAHVTALGLDTATDREVWQFAREHDYVLVSKDADFTDLAFVHGPPPKVVWLRIGNASTTEVRNVLMRAADAVAAFVENDQDSVLVLPQDPVSLR